LGDRQDVLGKCVQFPERVASSDDEPRFDTPNRDRVHEDEEADPLG